MTAEQLRHARWRRQGLSGDARGATAAAALERSGWSRSVASASPYLGVRARTGGSRTSVDAEVADVRIHELPAARGCTYIVPESHYAVALTVGRNASRTDATVARKHFGYDDAEHGRLCEGVERALQSGPKDPAELRAELGDLVRSFGEEGKKRGVTTSLPIALGVLQTEGRIRRIPCDGRLDQQRYRYALWSPGPFANGAPDPEEALATLARWFWEWIGPVDLAAFRDFAGIGVGAAKEAVTSLGLEAIDGELLALPGQREEVEGLAQSGEPRYALLGNLDSLVVLTGSAGHLLAPEDAERAAWGFEPGVRSMRDLAHQAILDRGRLIGFWDFDPDADHILWRTWVEPNAALREAVARAEAYVREELGDVRSFSLDSPKSRAARLDRLRAA